MEIKTVAVIGAGTMGNGIAQVVAQAGYNVIMTDIKEEFLAKGMSHYQRQPGQADQERHSFRRLIKRLSSAALRPLSI